MRSKYYSPLLADNYYHVFNRAVGNEKLFIEEKNYWYFLRKMRFYIVPIADLFAYSLIPNHFHLVLRIKPQSELIAYYESKKKRAFSIHKHDMPDFLMEQFSNWLNCYAKSFNNMYDRKGALFIDYTKRIEARLESDVTSFILYAHQNAVHHGLVKEIGDWPFDSYRALLSSRPTELKRDEVILWFGSKRHFAEFHNQPVHARAYRFINDRIGEVL